MRYPKSGAGTALFVSLSQGKARHTPLRRPLVVGHKGAGLSEPENTLRSIRRAMDIGVDAIEVDVRRSKDGRLVLMHDTTLDRTTNGKGKVDSLTLLELKALDAGQGEKVPTLEEVVELVGRKVGLVIEIKEPESLPEILEVVGRAGIADKTTFASAWHNSLRIAKERSPLAECEVMLGCEPVNPTVPATLALDAKADRIFLKRQFLSEGIVSEAHARLILVGAGSVNSADDLAQVLKLNVDVIGSDAPELIIGALR